MNRGQRWLAESRYFVAGVLIGLVIVTPALALPPDLPVNLPGDAQFFTLVVSGLILLAAVVMRAVRGGTPGPVAEMPERSYGTRFFPDDRKISLE